MIFERLLKLVAPKEEFESLSGDFQEIYQELKLEKGRIFTAIWYLFQVLLLIPPLFSEYVYWRIAMFKNYLKIAFRNILRYKIYSFITILGLTIGMTVFLMIILFVNNELSYDKYHKNTDRIYRIKHGRPAIFPSTPAPLAKFLKNRFPEIENTTRLKIEDVSTSYEDRTVKISNIFFTDPSFFDIFSIPVLKDSGVKILTKPNSIILTESQAKTIFGKKNPIGKIVKFDSRYQFTVTAIIKDAPQQSSMRFNAFVPFDTLNKYRDKDLSQDWSYWDFSTYLLLSKNTKWKNLENKMSNALIERFFLIPGSKKAKEYMLGLQPLKERYFNTPSYIPSRHGNREKTYIFLLIAIIILIIAIVNYINLSTARASTRAKEIGIRKIVGSKKSLLVRQILYESILMSFVAGIFSLCLFLSSIPEFNKLMESHIEIGVLFDFRVIMLIIGAVIVLGVLSGIYPALCLTTVKPVDVGKNQNLKRNKGLLARRILIVFQFTASIILIIGTITTDKQLSFIKNKDLGFNKDQILWFRMDMDITKNLNVFKNEILKNPNIKKISVSKYEFGVGGIWGIDLNGKEGRVYPMRVDAEYVNLLKLKIIEGRNFSSEIKGDEHAYILNERAVKEFDQVSVLGKRMANGDGFGKKRIIGVVKDFHFRSLHQEVPPVALVYYPRPTSNKWTVNVKISPQDISGTIAYVKRNWQKFSPGTPFQFEFLDDTLNNLYKAEQSMGKMFTHFSVLAILLACLGMFGLAAYTTELRTKEIGIRKALGSSKIGIVFLLSKEFMKWIILANTIAWPVGYILMNNWLQNFVYRWSISIWTFILSGFTILIIAVLTVCYFSIKAATANPVDVLKYE